MENEEKNNQLTNEFQNIKQDDNIKSIQLGQLKRMKLVSENIVYGPPPQAEDEVVVPFGVNNAIREGIVVQVQVVTKENEPYPIEKCKRMLRRL